MENYYITRFGFWKMTHGYTLKEINPDSKIYKKPIYFFSNLEETSILTLKEFLNRNNENLDKFEKNNRSLEYTPYHKDDTYAYVFEESMEHINIQNNISKYHSNENCFKYNFQIPEEIRWKDKTIEEIDTQNVEKYRSWFKAWFNAGNGQKFIIPNSDLIDFEKFLEDKTAQEYFVEEQEQIFQCSIMPKDIIVETAIKFTMLSIENLEEKIDALIKDASNYYKISTKNREILVELNFSKNTYLATSEKHKKNPIKLKKRINNSKKEYSDEEIREVCLDFYKKIKIKTINYLISYWILKLNPHLNFKENILEQLGFQPCHKCGHLTPIKDVIPPPPPEKPKQTHNQWGAEGINYDVVPLPPEPDR